MKVAVAIVVIMRVVGDRRPTLALGIGVVQIVVLVRVVVAVVIVADPKRGNGRMYDYLLLYSM